ncbi:oxidoreductase [Actinokineospora spheciospongiae]|uniref:oxidoreductase n=1 Tax=Actinokineospora spheciospongiae TaxID=909613 RepID=UPI000D71AF6A|nr:oxidoreductase [Actinokineospora spheciospongiae]PWW65310.1 NAD(P)-dependent dehydrogenase (short-subunit alcohol dehydrogenase family) [Actinokineospora spheciospongiae]
MTPWHEQDVPAVPGAVAVVTGANTGLGLETTRVLAQRGATVVMACRDQGKAAAGRAALIAAGVPGQQLGTASLDLADQGSVERFADSFGHDRLDLLINNAGLMAVARSRTADGFETQFGVNHLGHLALTLRLLPLLNATAGARVVTLTSMGHRPGKIRLDDPNFERGHYGRWRAYFQSKLANILFTAELGRRLTAAGHDTLSTAAHPGYAATGLGKDGRPVARLIGVVNTAIGQPAAMGAVPTLRAATDPDAFQGALYGPHRVMFGPAVPEVPSAAARDASLAARLWGLSLELLAPAKVVFPG